MDLQDGFILGIYSYCDRWCERCDLTSRCRLFAESAALDAARDSNFKAICDAPPLPQDLPPPPPKWLEELLDRPNDDTAVADARGTLPPKREILPEHLLIQARADLYCSEVFAWLGARTLPTTGAGSEPLEVVRWFHLKIRTKVARALYGLANDDPADRDWPADHDGSAKVALIGIDRSQAAWLELIGLGLVERAEVGVLLELLSDLGRDLERTFPGARGFVRPGLDEPEELAKLAGAEEEDSGLAGV